MTATPTRTKGTATIASGERPAPVGARGGAIEHQEAFEQLVVRGRDGDREAFAALYRARVADVGRYVGSMMRDVHRAEDVVAQTFLLAWRDLPKLRRPERFDAWLFRIARNQAMSELRRRPAASLDEAADPPDPSRFSSPHAVVEAREYVERIEWALDRLPETQRQVVVLRFLRGFSHAETAAQLGSTEEATRALQYRALARLRRLMEEQESGA